MPGDLSIGGGVYIYIPLAGVDYWPVTGVTQPQHQYEFVVTGDYTDVGSEGGLDLVAQGSGNSFNDGLVLNGSGYAKWTGTDADINALGDTYSVLMEGTYTGTGYMGFLSNGDTYYQPVFPFIYTASPYMQFRVYDGSAVTSSAFVTAISADVNYQYIYTQSGLTGRIYLNGTEVVPASTDMGTPAATQSNFYVGLSGNSWYWIGTIKRIGILKGEAWSADDVAAIYAGLS